MATPRMLGPLWRAGRRMLWTLSSYRGEVIAIMYRDPAGAVHTAPIDKANGYWEADSPAKTGEKMRRAILIVPVNKHESLWGRDR